MKWTEWVTFGLALLGAVLGVYNAWQGWNDRKVRLRVLPTYGVGYGGLEGEHYLSIEVVNVGAIAVTIEEVGLLIGRAQSTLPQRSPFPTDHEINNKHLPTRIEPHSSITMRVRLFDLPVRTDFTMAYARTSSGLLVEGTSDALRSVLEIMSDVVKR